VIVTMSARFGAAGRVSDDDTQASPRPKATVPTRAPAVSSTR
jgi:hypothetical protein